MYVIFFFLVCLEYTRLYPTIKCALVTPFRDATVAEGDTMQIISRYLEGKKTINDPQTLHTHQKGKNIKSSNLLFIKSSSGRINLYEDCSSK